MTPLVHSRMMFRQILVPLVAFCFLAGCVGTPATDSIEQRSLRGAAPAAESWIPQDVVWDTTGSHSHPLAKGIYEILRPEIVTFPSLDGVRVQAAYWRPNVPDGVKVPVIIDVGPYYGDEIEDPLGYIAPTIIEGLVPHGFAWAQVAVRGTAGSGGCEELFSVGEQGDTDAAVTYFGTQPWSNGNVALTGISYDGTTTWIGAQFGNPHLKTIVPISGLTSIYDHGVRNGTVWVTEPYLHPNYWVYGFQTDRRTPQDKVDNAACPEIARSIAVSTYTSLTGERDEPAGFDGYWDDRDFKPKILENYNGSVFLVQGLRDWRVPPYLAFPFMQELQAQGIETKMLLGQWWHDMPDNIDREYGVRWDYAEMLLKWFQKYLYEMPNINTGPAVDVEDDNHNWRTEENWPPPDLTWQTMYLGANTLRDTDGSAGDQILFSPASAHEAVSEQLPEGRGGPGVPLVEYRATTGPLEEDLRFAGLPRLHVTFLPSSPTGNRIQAQLLARDPSGAERDVAHAVMDLRFYEGGYETHVLTPGQPIKAKMEFLPVDALIPAGHELILKITGAGYSGERLTRGGSGYLDQWIPGPAELPLRVAWGSGQSELSLPIIERDVGDGKYPGQP